MATHGLESYGMLIQLLRLRSLCHALHARHIPGPLFPWKDGVDMAILELPVHVFGTW